MVKLLNNNLNMDLTFLYIDNRLIKIFKIWSLFILAYLLVLLASQPYFYFGNLEIYSLNWTINLTISKTISITVGIAIYLINLAL